MSIPSLGMIGVLVLIGWKLGPWLPLGLVAVTLALLGAANYMNRDARRLMQTDAPAARRLLNRRMERVGSALARVTAVWMAASLLILAVIVIAYLAR